MLNTVAGSSGCSEEELKQEAQSDRCSPGRLLEGQGIGAKTL